MSKYWKCKLCSKTYGPQANPPTCSKKECHNSPCDEVVQPPIKGGTFKITDPTLDKDIQSGLTGFSFSQAQKLVEDGKVEALRLMNEKLDHEKIGMSLDMHHFHASQWSKDDHDTMVPCEWRTSFKYGKGATPLEVNAMIDIDDIPPGVKVNGPDRPHVGWMLDASGPRHFKYTGHIFVDKVHVSRNRPQKEEKKQ
jgi:hypothetical protein